MQGAGSLSTQSKMTKVPFLTLFGYGKSKTFHLRFRDWLKTAMTASGQGVAAVRQRQEERRTGMRSSRTLLFARNFLKFPAMLGSFIPSSRFLVNDVLSKVDWDRVRVVVEFGPGVGTMTREILNRMRPDATLVAIELNREFADFLRKQVDDPRLHVVNASAGKVRGVLESLGLGQADCIISGVPYTNMPEVERREILQESRDALHPEGALLIYQFTRTVLPYLQSHFKLVQQGFQLLNIFPARIFHCTL